MTTYRDLVDEVLATLSANAGNAEERTHLAGDLGASSTTFQVADGTQVSKGLVEVDDELLWVSSVDRSGNTVNVEPYGRGYQGSTATSHSTNAPVLNNPRFPRSRIKATINQVLGQVYPTLFQVKTDTSQVFNAPQVTYPLPADCDFVLQTSIALVGPSGRWAPITRYRFDKSADTATYPTGRSLDIDAMATPGQKIKVVYIASPGRFAADTDTLTSIGLEESTRDVIVWGTCARLLQALEALRVQTGTVEQASRSALVPAGSTTNASRAFYALFQQRLSEEGDRLSRLHPVSVNIQF